MDSAVTGLFVSVSLLTVMYSACFSNFWSMDLMESFQCWTLQFLEKDLRFLLTQKI